MVRFEPLAVEREVGVLVRWVEGLVLDGGGVGAAYEVGEQV